MTERAAFLAAIAAAPSDATVRLVFADWLDEHDEPDLAHGWRAVAERPAPQVADWREHVWRVPAPEYAQPNVHHAQFSAAARDAINGMRNYGSCNLFHGGCRVGETHCLSYSHPRPAVGTSWTAEDEYTVEMWREASRGHSVGTVQRRAGRPEGMLHHRDFLALMGFAADALAAEIAAVEMYAAEYRVAAAKEAERREWAAAQEAVAPGLPEGYVAREEHDLRGTPPAGVIWIRPPYKRGKWSRPAAEKKGRKLTLAELKAAAIVTA